MKTALSTTTVRSIFSSARRFLSGTLLSKCFGLMREVTLAYTFGTGAQIASFMVAFRLAHFFRRFIGESGLGIAFIPHFEELKSRDPKSAGNFFVKISLSLKLLFAALACTIAASFYFGRLFVPPAWTEIFFLASILSFSLFFIGLYALNQAFLQTLGSFFTGSAAPVAFNLLYIAGALIAYQQTYTEPVIFLSWMVVAGFGAQWFVTAPLTARKHAALLDDLSTTAAPSDTGKKIAKASFLGLLGLAAVQINNVVDGIFAKFVDPSAPAYLWYAMRIYQLPLSLFAVSLASALLPLLSKVADDQPAFHDSLKAVSEKLIYFMIPCMGAMLVLAPTGIALLYGHGQFDTLSIYMTSICLWGYGVGLVSSCFVIILAQAFYALKDYKTPSLIALISVLLNITLNLLLTFYFGLGAPGIALATALATWFNAVTLAHLLKIGPLFNRTEGVKILFATVMATGVVLLWSVGKHDFSSKITLGLTSQIPTVAWPLQAKALAFKALAFVVVFLSLMRLLKKPLIK